jgi:hypothetical protein
MLLSEFWKKTRVSEAPGMVMKFCTMAMDPAMGSGTIASGAEMEAPWMAEAPMKRACCET